MTITRKERNAWSTRAKKYVAALEDTYELNDSEYVVLVSIARAMTRLDTIHDALAGEPLTKLNRFGEEVTHPLVVESRMLDASITKMIAALRLPEVDTDEKPQKRAGYRGTYRPRPFAVGGVRPWLD